MLHKRLEIICSIKNSILIIHRISKVPNIETHLLIKNLLILVTKKLWKLKIRSEEIMIDFNYIVVKMQIKQPQLIKELQLII